MHVIDLSAGWSVRAGARDVPAGFGGKVVPATVPGCVHTDLLDAGLLPDPYLDLNETLVQWVGLADWRYETTFPGGGASAGSGRTWSSRAWTRSRGWSSTVPSSRETRNMHRTYRFDVGPLLVEGTTRWR